MTTTHEGPDSTRDAGDSSVRVVPFELANRSYCVEIERVASVLGVTDETVLEDARDPWNAGTISIADERVRVVDLPRVLTAATRTLSRVTAPKLVVFEANTEYVGWLVDDVGRITSVRTESLAPPRTGACFLRGRLEHEGESLLWLDEQKINE